MFEFQNKSVFNNVFRIYTGVVANEERAMYDRRGYDADFIEFVFVQDLELQVRLELQSFALSAPTE